MPPWRQGGGVGNSWVNTNYGLFINYEFSLSGLANTNVLLFGRGLSSMTERSLRSSIIFRGQSIWEKWTVVWKSRTCHTDPDPAGRFSSRGYVYLPRPLGQTLVCLYSPLMLHVLSMPAHLKLALFQAMQQWWFQGDLFCGPITALLAFVCIPGGGGVSSLQNEKIIPKKIWIFHLSHSQKSFWNNWNYFIQHYWSALLSHTLQENIHTLGILTMPDNKRQKKTQRN